MSTIYCKMCGGDIMIAADKTFGTCEFCGSIITFPKENYQPQSAALHRCNINREIFELDTDTLEPCDGIAPICEDIDNQQEIAQNDVCKATGKNLPKTITPLATLQKRAQLLSRLIAAGEHHTVGTKADGTVVATKHIVGQEYIRHYRYYGQCRVFGWEDIVSVSTYFNHTAGLKSDGSVVVTEDYATTVGSQRAVSEWSDIVALASTLFQTVGLKSNGRVVAIGISDTINQIVSKWTNIVAIDVGRSHIVGLKANGTVVVAEYPDNIKHSAVTVWTDIVAIAAGWRHTVGLRSNGTVVSTRYKYTNYPMHDHGQCNVSHWTDIVAIAASDYHTVGLKADGTVVATEYTGDLTYYCGQCDVSAWRDIVAIAASNTHTVGLRSDGTVVATKYTYEPQYYSGQCDVAEWKLFDDLSDIEKKNIPILQKLKKLQAPLWEKASNI